MIKLCDANKQTKQNGSRVKELDEEMEWKHERSMHLWEAVENVSVGIGG